MRSLVLTSSKEGPRCTDCRGTRAGGVAARGALGARWNPLPRQSRRPQELPSRFPLPQGSTGPLANHDPPLPCLHARPAWTSAGLATLSENPASALGATRHPLHRLEKVAALTPHASGWHWAPGRPPPTASELPPWLRPGSCPRDTGPPAQPTTPPLASLSPSGWMPLTQSPFTQKPRLLNGRIPTAQAPPRTQRVLPAAASRGSSAALGLRGRPASLPQGHLGARAFGTGGGGAARRPGNPRLPPSAAGLWVTGPGPRAGLRKVTCTHVLGCHNIPLGTYLSPLCQEPRTDPTKARKVPGPAGQGRGDAHGQGSEQTGGTGSRGAGGGSGACPVPTPPARQPRRSEWASKRAQPPRGQGAPSTNSPPGQNTTRMAEGSGTSGLSGPPAAQLPAPQCGARHSSPLSRRPTL